jgi:hypothetical protein
MDDDPIYFLHIRMRRRRSAYFFSQPIVSHFRLQRGVQEIVDVQRSGASKKYTSFEWRWCQYNIVRGSKWFPKKSKKPIKEDFPRRWKLLQTVSCYHIRNRQYDERPTCEREKSDANVFFRGGACRRTVIPAYSAGRAYSKRKKTAVPQKIHAIRAALSAHLTSSSND